MSWPLELDEALKAAETLRLFTEFGFTDEHVKLSMTSMRWRDWMYRYTYDAAEMFERLIEFLVDKACEEAYQEALDEEFDRMFATPTPPSS